MTYKISEKVINLVQALIDEGYTGEALITNSYCSGTGNVLGKSLSVQLSGFCKENLYVVERDEEMVLVGRYATEDIGVDFTVEDIVNIAWSMYKDYKDSGYSRPSEFEDLFKKYGYLQEKTVKKLVEKD